ncbi:MAG: metallophosphoesterase [Deltaproteobacteria bacterium]|nr:metallophosphoesterase [Deltaproteobacteria bacterium]
MVWLARTRAAAVRVFFLAFFRLLIAAASAAQWAVLAWVAVVGLGAAIGWPLHLLGIAAFYAINRMLTRPGRRPSGAGMRLYTATAFVSLFCALFLLVTWVAFGIADGVLGVLAAQAVGSAGQGAVAAGTGGAFRWVASSGMAAIGLVMGYGYLFGQHELRVTRTEVPVSGLARPLRVAQISDIHVGQNLSHAQLTTFVAAVNATLPDLICITGDIADSPLADLDGFFPLLARLEARHGVLAILGNHDHAAGADRVAAALRRWTPFTVLRDDAVTLAIEDARLHVIGLDDRGRDWARGLRADVHLERLLAAAPDDVPRLLLSHRPDIFPQAASGDVVLTLAGHTHGGQLAVPWFGGRRRNLAEFITRFDRGLYRDGAAHLYVNAGLGVTGQRIRLWTPREISLFELAPASSA